MIFCFLSSFEAAGLTLSMLLALVLLCLMRRSNDLRDQAQGLAPSDRHPQDRLQRDITAFNDAFPPHLDWLPNTDAAPAKPDPAVDPHDWIKADEPAFKPLSSADPNPQHRSDSSLLDRWMPHIKPALFALSIIGVWFGFAAWYDNLSHYAPPTGDQLGDFRILYLKKTIGAVLPLISAVGASLGLLFMIHPRYYTYLNGWTSIDYDFFTDLQQLDEPKRFRRVLVFGLLFGLLLLASLYVLLHSSPQELTL